MAKASSLAPKERINVTFKPATGGAMEEIELPLKIMALGDFLQRHDPRRLLDRKPVQINEDNFDDVMEKQELGLQFSVPNRLRDNAEDEVINVKLNVRSLRDFTPEGVGRQVPELCKLLELREALVSLKGPLGNIPAFRKAIEGVLADDHQREMVMRELGFDQEDPAEGNTPPAPAAGQTGAKGQDGKQDKSSGKPGK
jgi:type VI secretion system protein ImpB